MGTSGIGHEFDAVRACGREREALVGDSPARGVNAHISDRSPRGEGERPQLGIGGCFK